MAGYRPSYLTFAFLWTKMKKGQQKHKKDQDQYPSTINPLLSRPRQISPLPLKALPPPFSGKEN